MASCVCYYGDTWKLWLQQVQNLFQDSSRLYFPIEASSLGKIFLELTRSWAQRQQSLKTHWDGIRSINGTCWAKPTQRCAEGRVAKFSANAGQVLPLTQFDSEPPWESWIYKWARLASSCGEGCSRQDKPDFHRRTRRLSTSLCCFFGSIFVPLFSYSFCRFS